MAEPKELLQTLVNELRQIAQAETIIGDPITVAGKTIIPVTRIMLGFGGGSGEGTAPANVGAPKGAGGGGGGGLKIEPAAFIVIEDEKLSVLAVPSPRGKLDALIEAIPELLGKLGEMKAKRGEKAEEKETEKGSKREEKSKP